VSWLAVGRKEQARVRCRRRVAVATVSQVPNRVTATQVAQASRAPAMASRKKWLPVATTTSVVIRG
jgi:hypothetical protein